MTPGSPRLRARVASALDSMDHATAVRLLCAEWRRSGRRGVVYECRGLHEVASLAGVVIARAWRWGRG